METKPETEPESGMSEDIVHAIVMSFHGSCNCSNSSLGFANPHCDAVEPEQEPEEIKKRHRRTTEREVYGGRGKSAARRCSRQTTK